MARIVFRYLVSSEGSYDTLHVFLDGVQRLHSGDTGDAWREAVLDDVAPGDHALTFRYSKDGSVDRGLDAAFVDDLRVDDDNYISHLENFESPAPRWTLSGSWARSAVRAYSGSWSLSHPKIRHGQAVEGTVTVTVPAKEATGR